MIYNGEHRPWSNVVYMYMWVEDPLLTIPVNMIRLTRCWVNGGPPSRTSTQHQPNIRSMSRMVAGAAMKNHDGKLNTMVDHDVRPWSTKIYRGMRFEVHHHHGISLPLPQQTRYIHPMLFQCWANVEDLDKNKFEINVA